MPPVTAGFLLDVSGECICGKGISYGMLLVICARTRKGIESGKGVYVMQESM